MPRKYKKPNNEYLVAMGERMQVIRQSRGINLREMGELCQINFTTLNRIENGYFGSRITTLKIIADVLECDVKDFL